VQINDKKPDDGGEWRVEGGEGRVGSGEVSYGFLGRDDQMKDE